MHFFAVKDHVGGLFHMATLHDHGLRAHFHQACVQPLPCPQLSLMVMPVKISASDTLGVITLARFSSSVDYIFHARGIQEFRIAGRAASPGRASHAELVACPGIPPPRRRCRGFPTCRFSLPQFRNLSSALPTVPATPRSGCGGRLPLLECSAPSCEVMAATP